MRISLLILVIVASQFLSAQDLIYRNYSMSNGLPSNEVHAAFQDSKGYMWFATDRGLVRFDGQDFQVYREDEGLPNSVLLAFIVESPEKVWMVDIENRMHSFNPLEQPLTFHPYEFNDTLSVMVNSIKGNYHVRNYWTDREGVSHFTFRMSPGQVLIDDSGNGKIECPHMTNYNLFDVDIHYRPGINGYANSEIRRDSLSPGEVRLINDGSKDEYLTKEKTSVDSRVFEGVSDFRMVNGEVWIIVGRHLYYWNNEWMPTVILEDNGMKIEFDEDKVFVATGKGCAVFNRTPAGLVKDRVFLPSEFCTSIIKDRSGGYWLTTLDNGIYYAAGSNIYSFGQEEVQSQVFSSMHLDDNYLFATTRNYELNLIDRSGNLIGSEKRYFLIDGIYGCGRGQKLSKYLGPEAYIDRLDGAETTMHFSKKYPEDSIWLSAVNYYLYISKGNEILEELVPDMPRMRDAVFMKDSSILVATEEGLYIIDINHGTRKYETGNPITEERLRSIEPFKDGFMLATKTNGIYYLNKGEVVVIDKEDGLLSNDISAMIVVDDNNVLLGTFNGIEKLQFGESVEDFSITHIGTEHGLPNQKVVSMALYHDSLWVSTAGGLCLIPNKSSFSNDLLDPDLLHIDSVLINSNHSDVVETYAINEGDEFELYFTQVSYDFSRPLVYQYRLNEEEWINLTESGVRLSALSAGEYTLEVRALSPTGLEGPIKSVSITVVPPFTKTWWFISLEILLLIVVVYFIVQFFVRRAGKRKQAELEKVQLEMKALISQMNPHFTFNTISSIQHYIIKKDKNEALDYLAEFASLIRKTLDFSRKEFISLQDEVDFLSEYAALEARRFDHRFEFRVENECQSDLSSIDFPALLLQPLLENAIIHGVSTKKEGGLILLKISEDRELFHVELSDNGQGLEKQGIKKGSNHKSHGTEILRQRIVLYNAEKYSENDLQFVNLEGSETGAVVKIRLYK